MSRAWLLPPHYRKNSLFRTTYRNVLVYWLSNLIIFPAYLICMFVIINSVHDFILEIPLDEWFNNLNILTLRFTVNLNATTNLFLADVARVIAWVFALLPLVSTSLVPRHYHYGLRHRRWLLLVAFIIIISWILLIDLNGFERLFLWIINVGFHGVVIFFIFNTWKLRRYLLLGGILLVALGLAIFLTISLVPEIVRLESFLFIFTLLFIIYFSSKLKQSIFWAFTFGFVAYLSLIYFQTHDNPLSSEIIFYVYGGVFLTISLREIVLKYFSWSYTIIPLILTLLIYFLSLFVQMQEFSFISLCGVYYYLLVVTIVISLGGGRDPLQKLYGSSRQDAAKSANRRKIILVGSLFVFYFIAIFSSQDASIIAILGILALISAYSRVFSRQRAYWLYHARHIRYDMIQARHSPLAGTSHWVNILFRQWIPSILNFNNRRLYLVLSIILGGIVLPLLVLWQWQNEANTPIDVLGLLFVGVAGASSFISIYFVLYAINNRSRYIVNRFTINDPQNNAQASPELAAVTNLTTSLLTEELQRIAVLLEMRQIENVHFSPDDNNAFFVTTGLDRQFNDQIQQAMSVEISQKGVINFAPLLEVATKLMANIVIEGKVQKRTNGSLEVWVHMNHGNQGSIAIEHTLVPENNIAEIDEVLLRPVLRAIAIKLFIEMGDVTHLSSTEDSMSDLLNGLDASANRNWWRAIAYYRRILNTEETRRSSYGIGHYHLGAALIFQGDWKLGLEHLRTAELDGPRIAETQYMLALTLLYLYWGQLHKRRNVFNQIESYINVAISLRPNFPEAYQLLGTAFYRRARQIEVVVTRPSQEKSNFTIVQYQYAYRQSVKCLSKALHQYDNRQDLQTKAPNFYNTTQTVAKHRNQQRMTAAHQLGDALRGLELYTEAETYYRTVDLILPRNPRNLNDLVKTLCLSGNWQHAEEFLWRKVFVHDIAWWDADSCFHMGWTILGGIFDSKQIDKQAVFRQKIDGLATDWYDYRVEDERRIPNSTVYQFAEAMKYLDYALHQRPRYMTYWHQTNWAAPFHHVAKQLTGSRDISKLVDNTDEYLKNEILCKPIMAEKEEHENLLKADKDEEKASKTIQRLAVRNQLWIALRLDSYTKLNSEPDASQQEDIGFIKNRLNLWKWDKAIQQAIGVLSKNENQADENQAYQKDAYDNLKLNRTRVLNYLKALQKAPRSTGLILGYVRLHLAQSLLDDWEYCKKAFDSFIEKTKGVDESPTLLDRWHLEIYAETAMLTLRTLAEAECYEKVFEIASEACEVMINWIRWWRNKYRSGENKNQSNHHQTFTPRVSRYHHASFYAWKAFGLYHCMFDKSAKIRSQNTEILEKMVGDHVKDKLIAFADNPQVAINAIQEYLKNAQEHIHHHPLTMYMQGLIYQKQNLYGKAVEEYEGLIDLISPYDPKTQIGIDNLPVGDYEPDEPLAESGDRTRMYYMERVCGRQQFYNTVSLPKIHNAIAECYKQMDKPLLRVDHLLEAIRQSPNNDQRIENFLQLAYQLNNIERYEEAEAILEAIESPLNRLGNARVSTSIYQIPDVLVAIVKARAKNYAASMNYAREFASKIKLSIDDFTEANLDAQRKILQLMSDKFELKNTDNQTINDAKASFRQYFNDAKERLAGNTSVTQTDTLRAVHSSLFRESQDRLPVPDNLEEIILDFIETNEVRFPDNHDNNILRIFQNISRVEDSETPEAQKFDWGALNKAAKGARIILNEEERATLFYVLREPRDNAQRTLKNSFRIIMESNIAMYLSREYSNKLSQFSELCNTLAYSRAETGQQLIHAYYDSAVAISVMYYLIYTSTQSSDVRRTFELKQAQFLDTFGWVRYRNFLADPLKIIPFNIDEISPPNDNPVNAFSGSQRRIGQQREHYKPEQLAIAERYLLIGIRYNHKRAIIHYHLSRLYLTRVETLWQRVPKIHNPDVANFAPVIDTSITQSFRHLRNAREFDHFKRLHTRISWLNNRLRMYKLAWEKRQFRGIAGDDTADSVFFELGGISHIE